MSAVLTRNCFETSRLNQEIKENTPVIFSPSTLQPFDRSLTHCSNQQRVSFSPSPCSLVFHVCEINRTQANLNEFWNLENKVEVLVVWKRKMYDFFSLKNLSLTSLYNIFLLITDKLISYYEKLWLLLFQNLKTHNFNSKSYTWTQARQHYWFHHWFNAFM